MTVIAAYEDKDAYWIGSDSHGVNEDTWTSQDCGSKLIRKGSYVVGFSSSYRTADIIRESSDLPVDIRSIKDLRLFRDVLMMELTDKAGVSSEGKDGEVIQGPVSIILISTSGIYEIQEDYAIFRVKTGYSATGSGFSHAFGSLYTSKFLKLSGKKAVELAVNSAIMHSAACSGKCYKCSVKKVK